MNKRTEYNRKWRENNRKKFNDYQREYRRKYRAEGRDKKLKNYKGVRRVA